MKNIKASLLHILNIKYVQWFSQGQFCPSRDIWQYPETFLAVTTGEKECYWDLWVEVRDAAQHPTVHRTAPQQRVIQHEVLLAQAEKFLYPLHSWLFISIQPYVEFSIYSFMANRTFNYGYENILFLSFFLFRYSVFFYAKAKLATSSFSLPSPRAKLRLSSDSSLLGLSRALRRVFRAPWGLRYTLLIYATLA